MEIKVLGSGCPTCKTLYELVQDVAKEIGLEDEVLYVTDITVLIDEGVDTSPALKINDKIVCAGRVPSREEVKKFLATKSVCVCKCTADCDCSDVCDCDEECVCEDGSRCDENCVCGEIKEDVEVVEVCRCSCGPC